MSLLGWLETGISRFKNHYSLSKGFYGRQFVESYASRENWNSEYTGRGGFAEDGGERMKEPFHGMKMYAKNQEVAACLPAAEELKHFRLRGEGNIRHPEKPKRRQRRRNCT